MARKQDSNTAVGEPAAEVGESQLEQPAPTVGRIVHFVMDSASAVAINARRIAKPSRYQGRTAQAGATCPMMITCVFDALSVSGQVFLDGNDSLWVKTATRGDQPGQWSWPQRT